MKEDLKLKQGDMINQTMLRKLDIADDMNEQIDGMELMKNPVFANSYPMKVWPREEVVKFMKSQTYRMEYKKIHNRQFPTAKAFPKEFPSDPILYKLCGDVKLIKWGIALDLRKTSKYLFDRYYRNFPRHKEYLIPEFTEAEEKLWYIITLLKNYVNYERSIFCTTHNVGIYKFHDYYRLWVLLVLEKNLPEYSTEITKLKTDKIYDDFICNQ